MAEVKIDVPGGAYTIHIRPGGLGLAGKLIGELGLTRRALVITDDQVAPLYGGELLSSLKGAGIAAELVAVKAGEAAKSLAVAEELYTKAIRSGIDRRSPVIALGGRCSRRFGRLCRRYFSARRSFRSNSDHAFGAGRFQCRRQSRRQPFLGEKPDRRVLSTPAGYH